MTTGLARHPRPLSPARGGGFVNSLPVSVTLRPTRPTRTGGSGPRASFFQSARQEVCYSRPVVVRGAGVRCGPGFTSPKPAHPADLNRPRTLRLCPASSGQAIHAGAAVLAAVGCHQTGSQAPEAARAIMAGGGGCRDAPEPGRRCSHHDFFDHGPEGLPAISSVVVHSKVSPSLAPVVHEPSERLTDEASKERDI